MEAVALGLITKRFFLSCHMTNIHEKIITCTSAVKVCLQLLQSFCHTYAFCFQNEGKLKKDMTTKKVHSFQEM